jgi:hypothetical protein
VIRILGIGQTVTVSTGKQSKKEGSRESKEAEKLVTQFPSRLFMHSTIQDRLQVKTTLFCVIWSLFTHL